MKQAPDTTKQTPTTPNAYHMDAEELHIVDAHIDAWLNIDEVIDADIALAYEAFVEDLRIELVERAYNSASEAEIETQNRAHMDSFGIDFSEFDTP